MNTILENSALPRLVYFYSQSTLNLVSRMAYRGIIVGILILLGIPSLSGTGAAYPVIVQTKAFGYALWIDRFAWKMGARKQYGMLVR